MDQIIEKIILAEITYDDFLTNGCPAWYPAACLWVCSIQSQGL